MTFNLTEAVQPQHLPSVQDEAGRRFIVKCNFAGADPALKPQRKSAYADTTWNVPGVGEFALCDVVKVFATERDYLLKIIKRYEREGKLPAGWGVCLWLCAVDQDFYRFCQGQPSGFSRLLPSPDNMGYKLGNMELLVLFGLSEYQITQARAKGSTRVFSLIFEWWDRHPVRTLEWLVNYQLTQIGLADHEKYILGMIKVRLEQS